MDNIDISKAAYYKGTHHILLLLGATCCVVVPWAQRSDGKQKQNKTKTIKQTKQCKTKKNHPFLQRTWSVVALIAGCYFTVCVVKPCQIERVLRSVLTQNFSRTSPTDHENGFLVNKNAYNFQIIFSKGVIYPSQIITFNNLEGNLQAKY